MGSPIEWAPEGLWADSILEIPPRCPQQTLYEVGYGRQQRMLVGSFLRALEQESDNFKTFFMGVHLQNGAATNSIQGNSTSPSPTSMVRGLEVPTVTNVAC